MKDNMVELFNENTWNKLYNLHIKAHIEFTNDMEGDSFIEFSKYETMKALLNIMLKLYLSKEIFSWEEILFSLKDLENYLEEKTEL